MSGFLERSGELVAARVGRCVVLWVSMPLFFEAPLLGGSIEGQVTNIATGAGLQGVQVTARSNSNVGGWVISSEDGGFRIEDLPDGDYTISTPRSAPLTVKVTGETHFDFKAAGVSVRGRVLDPDGKEAEGITVRLGAMGTVAARAVTDEHGEFVVDGVGAGTYTLSALAPDGKNRDGEKIIDTDFPQQINVAGADLLGYTIQLQKVAVRHVKGVVRPAGPAEVRLITQPAATGLWLYGGPRHFPETLEKGESVTAAEDGSFEFTDVREGDWILLATVTDRDEVTGVGSTREQGSIDLHVGRDDIDGVKLQMASPFSIVTTPELSGNGPNVFADLAMIVPMAGALGFPGRYLILPQTYPGFYLAAVMLDGRDVKGQMVELDGPAEIHTIYKSDGGTVRGRVENGAGAAVVLMSADPETGIRIGYSARCDDAGGFVIQQIAPGSYTSAAFPDADEVRAGQFLDKLATAGERVNVEAASEAIVNLRIVR